MKINSIDNNKINELLSGDDEIDAYALLNILKKKFKDGQS